MRWFRRLLGISYRDHVTSEEVRNNTRYAIESDEVLITSVRKTLIDMVWARNRMTGTCRDDPRGHGTRKEKDR